jgi:hypothetical protein
MCTPPSPPPSTPPPELLPDGLPELLPLPELPPEPLPLGPIPELLPLLPLSPPPELPPPEPLPGATDASPDRTCDWLSPLQSMFAAAQSANSADATPRPPRRPFRFLAAPRPRDKIEHFMFEEDPCKVRKRARNARTARNVRGGAKQCGCHELSRRTPYV